MQDRIAAIRRFSRFYTGLIGLLDEAYLGGGHTLAEARVLQALDASPASPGAIGAALGLDAGYLSRILQRFERDGLVVRETDAADGRRALIRLTQAGHAAFAPLDRRARDQVAGLLAKLPDAAQAELVAAMGRVERLLGPDPASPIVLRPPRAGDIGWVIARHGVLYAAEYGWVSAPMEAYVAQVAGDFLAKHDPACEACWIAERDGVNLGSIFIMRETDELARLRLLFLEPAARGAGLGRRLVETAIGFSREAGYRRITLWTHTVLTAARAIYASAGFRIVATETHTTFGVPVDSEEWLLDLR
jgi:DNA-binding MarR family transcriptional regulator/GNAT superfamily N-acetyltransferase